MLLFATVYRLFSCHDGCTVVRLLPENTYNQVFLLIFGFKAILYSNDETVPKDHNWSAPRAK